MISKKQKSIFRERTDAEIPLMDRTEFDNLMREVDLKTNLLSDDEWAWLDRTLHRMIDLYTSQSLRLSRELFSRTAAASRRTQ